MDKAYIWIFVFIAGLAIFFGRNFFYNKTRDDLLNIIGKDDDKFLKMIDGFSAKLFIEPFNRDYMKLNHYILTKNESKIFEQFNTIDEHKLNKDQTLVLYQHLFKYYVKATNLEKAEDIYERLCKYVDENKLSIEIKEDFEKDIKVYLTKDLSVLSLLERRMENANNDLKALLYLEKAYVLKHNDRMEEALSNMKKVIEYTSNTNQKQVMQDLLNSDLKAL